tara:strand:- start:55 stop:189 length:135 start_codon:yes stop_codon:yes gene_type:complete
VARTFGRKAAANARIKKQAKEFAALGDDPSKAKTCKTRGLTWAG